MTKKNETQSKRGAKRHFEGVVVSNKSDKTVHVSVKTTKTHPKYRKQYTVSKKYAVHDEKNQANPGDTVRFREDRPISKSKKWRLVSIVKKAQA